MSLIAGDIAGLFLLGAALALVTGATRQRRAGQAEPPAQPTRPAEPITEPAGPGIALAWEPAPAAWQAVLQEPACAPPLPVLVEDRLPGPAPLELEEAVGAGDQDDAVPEPCGSLAARNR